MAMQGKNTCAFTYGASGSGKTYTIMGGQGDQAGVLPRTVSALFNCLGDKLGMVAQPDLTHTLCVFSRVPLVVTSKRQRNPDRTHWNSCC